MKHIVIIQHMFICTRPVKLHENFVLLYDKNKMFGRHAYTRCDVKESLRFNVLVCFIY